MSQSGSDKSSRKDGFLRALSRTGNISAAVRESGLPRSTVYFWRSHDQEFSSHWDEALAEATDRLAYEARRRALAIEVAAAFMDAGLELGAPVRWGGMWTNFEDIPHIELASSAHSGARPIRSALQPTDRESG